MSPTDSDPVVLKELGQRLEHHRLNRNQTQAALAQEAGVSVRTIVRLEQGESVQLTNLIRVLRVHGLLENLDALVPAPAPSPFQLAKLRGRVRRRASSETPRGDETAAEPWTWGDER